MYRFFFFVDQLRSRHHVIIIIIIQVLIEPSWKSNPSAAQLGRLRHYKAFSQLVGLESSDVAKAERPLQFPRDLAKTSRTRLLQLAIWYLNFCSPASQIIQIATSPSLFRSSNQS
jgi:hypothetical protein